MPKSYSLQIFHLKRKSILTHTDMRSGVQFLERRLMAHTAFKASSRWSDASLLLQAPKAHTHRYTLLGSVQSLSLSGATNNSECKD